MIEKINIPIQYIDKVKYFHSKFVNTYGDQWKNIINDQAALLAACNFYEIDSFCEIGTWEGYTSLLIWLNVNLKNKLLLTYVRILKAAGASIIRILTDMVNIFQI